MVYLFVLAHQWNGLIYRAMTEKLDWDRSADEYLRVFGSLLG